MIELDVARRQLLAACPTIEPAELHVADAVDCVLARDVRADGNVPPFDNTSVDGYAVHAAELAGATHTAPVTLRVLGSILAGESVEDELPAGHAWKVMTGAPVPPGADAVVMVENSSAGVDDPRASAGDTVQLFTEVRAGTGLRRAGSDVAAGDVVFTAGTVLRPAHLGVLASIGVQKVSVHRRLRVGVLVTGDELVVDAAPLRPGQIYESNRAMLMALLRRINCEPVDLGVAGDDPDTLRTRLGAAIAECDVVLTSGGVSMGDADPVKLALDRMGRLNWLQIAIRPAKPFAFGVLDGPTLLLGLPGNPVSAMVSFELMAGPALRHMMGHRQPFPQPIRAIADTDLGRSHRDGRTGYLRVTADFAEDGRLHVRPVAKQESHQLSATAAATALARIPDGAQFAAGDEVDVVLLS